MQRCFAPPLYHVHAEALTAGHDVCAEVVPGHGPVSVEDWQRALALSRATLAQEQQGAEQAPEDVTFADTGVVLVDASVPSITGARAC